MGVRAYLLSFLARQQLMLKQGFGPRYPHAWLVWEPGSWRAPPVNASVAETRLPGKGHSGQASAGDALCFELSMKSSKEKPLRLGRAEENELVIADATVSREHCRLWLEGTVWTVRASESVKAMKVAGRPLAAGAEVALQPGEGLDLGEVSLTLLDASRFLERVSQVASKLGS